MDPSWVNFVSIVMVWTSVGLFLDSQFYSIGLSLCYDHTVFDYCNFVVSFEIKEVWVSKFVLLFPDCISVWIWGLACPFLKKKNIGILTEIPLNL